MQSTLSERDQPEGQSSHFAVSSFRNLPFAHAAQLVLPTFDVAPSRQCLHVAAFKSSEYLPAMQLEQMVLPNSFIYLPGKHGIHATLCFSCAMNPAGQRVQEVLPFFENFPEIHAVWLKRDETRHFVRVKSRRRTKKHRKTNTYRHNRPNGLHLQCHLRFLAGSPDKNHLRVPPCSSNICQQGICGNHCCLCFQDYYSKSLWCKRCTFYHAKNCNIRSDKVGTWRSPHCPHSETSRKYNRYTRWYWW